MKRRTYIAELLRGNRTLATATAYAMNSGIRASEALIREYARSVGYPFEGGRAERYGEEYRRHWTGEGEILTTRVVEVFS